MLLARPEFRGTMSGRRYGRASEVKRRMGFGGISGAAPARTASQILRRTRAMITCQRCQTENLDGSQYCDECGAALSDKQPQAQPQGSTRTPADDGHASPVTAPAEASAFDAPAHEPRRRATVETP